MNKKQKQSSSVRNWREYNAGLVERESLTVWLDESALSGWCEVEKSGGRGASLTYSATAIQAILLLKAVYHLPLRAAQGFATSVLGLLGLRLGLSVPVPHYSTLSRRQIGLELTLPLACRRNNEALHLVVDSTGCKVYGEGEWKVRVHGKSKRRTWRKLHLGVDESSGEIVAAVLSSNNVSDGEVLPMLLAQVEEPLAQLSGDGAYDQRLCYEALHQRELHQRELHQQRKEAEPTLKVTIPPRRGARIWQHGNRKQERLARDKNLREILTCPPRSMPE